MNATPTESDKDLAVRHLSAMVKHLRAEIADLRSPLRHVPLVLTGHQINLLREFTDGDPEFDVRLQYFKAGVVTDDNDLPYPAGLFACSDEYPDEGWIPLPPQAEQSE